MALSELTYRLSILSSKPKKLIASGEGSPVACIDFNDNPVWGESKWTEMKPSVNSGKPSKDVTNG